MPLIICPECNSNVSSKAVACPHCGYPISSSPVAKKSQNRAPSARRKHPKLPNGYGSIKRLSGNRSNPYAVHPPTTEFTKDGVPLTPSAICYAPDWYTGFYALQSWHNGTFSAELLKEIKLKDTDAEYNVVAKILSAYNTYSKPENEGLTFAQVYEKFYSWKFSQKKEYAVATRNGIKAGYKNCKSIHHKIFTDLTTADLQKVIDDCPLKHSSKELIVNVLRQMYKYADMENLCTKDYSSYITINTPNDDEKGIPFSVKELDFIWEHSNQNEVMQEILIMCYSGFRIGAYSKLEVNFKEHFFRGGIKTKSSKNRIVPFSPLIESFINPGSQLFTMPPHLFRPIFIEELAKFGISGHTPHDCRHTFSWLCDKYKVDPFTKKLLLGHSLGQDVTEARYGHRTIDELRTEIEKIKHW